MSRRTIRLTGKSGWVAPNTTERAEFLQGTGRFAQGIASRCDCVAHNDGITPSNPAFCRLPTAVFGFVYRAFESPILLCRGIGQAKMRVRQGVLGVYINSTLTRPHHGLVTTLREATLAHVGEAEASRRAFEALSGGEQDRVIEFLKSLRVQAVRTHDDHDERKHHAGR